MRLRIATVAAAAALLMAGTATGVATAAPAETTGTGSGLAVAQLPPGDGSLLGSLQPDPHTAWAFGMRFTPQGGKGVSLTPLLLADDDRDGEGWHEVPLAPFTGTSRINAAAAAPAGSAATADAWLVGDRDASLGGVLTEHWDGSSWQLVTAPLPDDARDGGLLSVSEVSPHDVWAAGWADITDSTTTEPGGGAPVQSRSEALIEHWDGRTWQQIAVPGAADFQPSTVLARGPHDVWAAGYAGDDQPVVEHWDGHAWSQATLPVSGLYGEIDQIAVDGSGTLWAVGRTLLTPDDRGHALVLRRSSGGAWQQVAAPATAGALSGLAVTPGGITVVGDTAADDATAVASRLTGTHWTALPLPAPSADAYQYLVGVSASPAGLTLAGGTQLADDQEPQPLVITGS
jgi:hypothetical protein